MDVTLARAAALVAVLALCCAFGLFRRARDGRTRRLDTPRPPVLTAVQVGAELGSRATLLQFSSPFCGPCRSTQRLLGQVAGDLDGVSHVEVDATRRLDLVRDLDVHRTPTVLVLDAEGRVRGRAVGVPDRAELVATLDGICAGALRG
ncbi:MAG TPA: thioredoxin family protein [Kineosporiaceae bacterium]|nr:thioredoxin family protein [Kineosporiaceae bacterium]